MVYVERTVLYTEVMMHDVLWYTDGIISKSPLSGYLPVILEQVSAGLDGAGPATVMTGQYTSRWASIQPFQMLMLRFRDTPPTLPSYE